MRRRCRRFCCGTGLSGALLSDAWPHHHRRTNCRRSARDARRAGDRFGTVVAVPPSVAECRSCVTPTLSMAVRVTSALDEQQASHRGRPRLSFSPWQSSSPTSRRWNCRKSSEAGGREFPVKTLALLCKAQVQRFQGTDRWHGEFRSAAQSWDEQERVIEAHGQPSDSATCSSSFICSSRTISMPELRAASRASELASSMRSVSLVRP